MHLKTIFNRVAEYKPFVVGHVHLVEYDTGPVMEVIIRARERTDKVFRVRKSLSRIRFIAHAAPSR